LTAIRGRGGRPATNHRLILDAVFWIARTCSPWRDLPVEFGKWSSVYRQFRRWTIAGLWELVLDALNDSGALPDQVQMIDKHRHPRPSLGSRRKSLLDVANNVCQVIGGLKKKVLAAQKVASRPKSTSLPTLMDCLSGRK